MPDRIRDAWLRPSRDAGPFDQSGQDWLDRVNQTWFPIHPLPDRQARQPNEKCQHCVNCNKPYCFFDPHHYCQYLFCDVMCPDYNGQYECKYERIHDCVRWPDIVERRFR